MKKNRIYLVALVLIIVAIIAYALSSKPAPVTSIESLSTTEAPWPAEWDRLKDRLAAARLPALAEEGNALHIHQHLQIFVHGKPVPVPADIGVHKTFPTFISPIHTHDASGIVHIESPTVETFTLGQFFDVWGVRLSDACVGAYCTDATSTVAVYVNGERHTGDPRAIELAAHQEIVVTYGTATELPAPIPASYSFPAGY